MRESRLSHIVGRVSPHERPGLDFPGYSLTKLIRSGRRPVSQVPISKKDWLLPVSSSKQLDDPTHPDRGPGGSSRRRETE